MSNTKFTPGPWERGGFTALEIYGVGSDKLIAEVASGEGRHANAALISAAPDLYAALTHLVLQVQAAGIAADLNLDLVERALDKAEGLDGAE